MKESINKILNMSKIVSDLFQKGQTDEEIMESLGMEKDEVIRLKQISGLKEAFSNHEFSKSWIELIEKTEDIDEND